MAKGTRGPGRDRKPPKRYGGDIYIPDDAQYNKLLKDPTLTKARNSPSRSPGDMSSKNGRRAPSRFTSQGNGEEHQIWAEMREKMKQIDVIEANTKVVSLQIIEMEEKFKARQDQGIKPSPSEINQLDQLYRANVKNTEEMKSVLSEDFSVKIGVLKGLVEANEEEASTRATSSRDSHSRSAMDLDGSNDSPGPSTAENKHVRKLGAGRPSSQPPRDKEKDTAEPSEPSSSNSGRTKIVFAMGAEVAFKPKVQNQTVEHDWIQGIVIKVIGEGKSRRYDVQDPFPDDASKNGLSYRSSASSMVPIPPVGSPLGPYEVGRQVLALYPETTTFYRAVVKEMLQNGTKVQLLFEDDEHGMKTVDRRFVLDHKG